MFVDFPQDKDPKKADNLTCLLLGLLGLALLLEDLLDDLLLLNEESTDDTVADAVAAAGTTVGTLDSLLGLGELSVLAGAEGRDLCDSKVPSAYVFRRVATVAVVHNSSFKISYAGGPGRVVSHNLVSVVLVVVVAVTVPSNLHHMPGSAVDSFQSSQVRVCS